MSSLTPTLLSEFAAGFTRGRVVIGFSGGLDSTVLLDLAVQAGLARDGRLRALHINHQLQADAPHWASHCQSVCAGYGIPCEVVKVRVAATDSLEQAARDARYQAFSDRLQPGDWLLLGQHADDQSETLLLRLLRGAGVRGLAAMPAQRTVGAGRLWRPLLDYPRDELACYARERELRWIEDDSNRDPRFDRNFLRAEVMPRLRHRWPGLNAVLGRAARLQGEANQLLDELAAEDLSLLLGQQGLDLPGVLALSSARQRNLLRYWLRQQGAGMPPLKRLQQFLLDLRAADDRQPQLCWGDWALRRYRGRLLLQAGGQAVALDHQRWSFPERLSWAGGELWAEPTRQGGLRLPAGAEVLIRGRQGGERIRLAGRGERALKKLLQEAGVPPWLRNQLPLIYVDGQLAAVADRWLDAAYVAEPGAPGWRICWRPETGA